MTYKKQICHLVFIWVCFLSLSLWCIRQQANLLSCMHLGWMYSPLMNISQARRPLGCPDVDNLKTKQAEESKTSTLRINIVSSCPGSSLPNLGQSLSESPPFWKKTKRQKDKKTKMFSFSIDCVVTPCSQCLWEPLECKSNLRMHVKDLHWPLCNLYLVSTDFEAFPTSKNCSAGSLIMHRISILSRLFPTALLHSQ